MCWRDIHDMDMTRHTMASGGERDEQNENMIKCCLWVLELQIIYNLFYR